MISQLAAGLTLLQQFFKKQHQDWCVNAALTDTGLFS